ncbi:UDP-N-acetylglucosamine 1-carboxyvinyltransferase [Candidatus Nomurabacteria bacterium CG10_big_fil_rev_8_21_14_0_10_35_16]|uniref:UDP-N-acetylglucosamine 1-carboxyvinyltransferase n=1 Tax=Candidatus Nomurabacteria bacterium CG10_big_fil_rev_8_21_14_0_10_35_16 TaxID=1974731 RepID=A0A2H0TAR4_9BACT|nr:MAG: UDP-N-acetylglucosamine 1-carboxyvinyltransferase [Candidatus Nomurabacteria bacterium CG10_big_fil_rev_8_21_14_0_10_35_16]
MKKNTNHINNFEIEGGFNLSGSINTNTSKNGSVGLLCASLLNRGKTTLHGISHIEEVFRIIEVLESIGVRVKWVGKQSLEIIPPKRFKMTNLNKEAAIKTRSIIMFAGPLLHHLKTFSLPHAQGCKLGKRTVSAHIYGLEELGAKVEVTNQSYEISYKKLKPNNVVMYESSDTACENLLFAASRIKGKTTIKFAASNYMVQEICFFLQKLGVRIEGIGGNTLTIYGNGEIKKNIEYYNSEDPIESMMWITGAIVTNSKLEIKRCPIDFLELELYKLKKMGLKYKVLKRYKSKNDRTKLVDLMIYPSKLRALEDKIEARPFPGINIDNLPFLGLIAACAKGQTLIHDWVYENRAIYLTELNRLGANVLLADPHRVFVEGPTKWKSADVVCPPALRPSVVIMLAMMGAKGKSTLHHVYMIKRGYENIVERFQKLGAKIKDIS